MKSLWRSGGSLVMAVLSVLALGLTVLVAHRGLSEASDVMARGEGEALVGQLVSELSERYGLK
jgi:hypothetical protein